MKTATVLATMLAGSFFLAMPAHAVDIGAGTSEYVTARDCVYAGVSGCDEISNILYGQYGGLPGDALSSAAQSIAGYGSASGSVSLSGVIGAPILRASASSEADKRLNTNSVALQRYVYDGAVSATRTFGGSITYSQVSTGDYPVGVGVGIYAALEVFTLPTSTIAIDPTSAANFQMLFNGYVNLPGYVSLGTANYSDKTSTTSGAGSLGVTVNLNPGDAVWVWALVQTPAVNGGWVDSSHTFVTAWDDPASLVPTVVAVVPEPGPLALWMAGAAFLAAVVRRRPAA